MKEHLAIGLAIICLELFLLFRNVASFTVLDRLVASIWLYCFVGSAVYIHELFNHYTKQKNWIS